MNEPHWEPATCDVIPKIGCVQHDCDKCKAQAENNAELLRTVRAQAVELERLREDWLKALAYASELRTLMATQQTELEAAKAKIASLRRSLNA